MLKKENRGNGTEIEISHCQIVGYHFGRRLHKVRNHYWNLLRYFNLLIICAQLPLTGEAACKKSFFFSRISAVFRKAMTQRSFFLYIIDGAVCSNADAAGITGLLIIAHLLPDNLWPPHFQFAFMNNELNLKVFNVFSAGKTIRLEGVRIRFHRKPIMVPLLKRMTHLFFSPFSNFFLEKWPLKVTLSKRPFWDLLCFCSGFSLSLRSVLGVSL